MMTVRESLPYMAAEVIVGLLASLYGVEAFYQAHWVVAAASFVVSVAAFALATAMWNGSDR